MSSSNYNLEYLLEKNKEFVKNYEQNELMVLVKSHSMADSKKRALLLDCIQVFSNYFQKTIMLRSVLTENKMFLDIVHMHLVEEFGHDISLMNDRQNNPPKWDPILESCSCWFAWKMFTLDNVEKTLLVHLVLEASAHLFFREAHRVMDAFGETDYFKIHSELDEHHETMGLELLEGLREVDYQHLLVIQQQGWDILNAVCHRISELTIKAN
jgi:hypothetical protein